MDPSSLPTARSRKRQARKEPVDRVLEDAVTKAVSSAQKDIQAKRLSPEGHFPLLANSMPVAVWIADTEKRRHWFNDRWFQFTGRSLEQEFGDGWKKACTRTTCSVSTR